MFLVQSSASLDFNFLFIVFLDLDIGTSGHWQKVTMEFFPWLPSPFVPQNLRVGGHLDKFVSVNSRTLHAGQGDDKSACSEPSTLLGMQACGIETVFTLPRNLAHFLIMVFLWKTKQNFLKGHKISFHHRIVKCGFYKVLDVFTERHQKHTSFYFQPICTRRALQDTYLKWPCTFWFPN